MRTRATGVRGCEFVPALLRGHRGSARGVHNHSEVLGLPSHFVVLDVLADPIRAGIVEALGDGDRSVNEIVEMFDLTQPAISRHLRILRDAQMVTVRAEAQRRLYSLNPAPLREIDRWLDRYRRFWSQRLDALDGHLDRRDKTPS